MMIIIMMMIMTGVMINSSACLYGGGSRKGQIDLVSSGLEIVIGDVVYVHSDHLGSCLFIL